MSFRAFRGRRLTVGCPVVVSLLPREWSYWYRRFQPQNSFLNSVNFSSQPSNPDRHLQYAGAILRGEMFTISGHRLAQNSGYVPSGTVSKYRAQAASHLNFS